jgi:biotin transport system substrate-specific component
MSSVTFVARPQVLGDVLPASRIRDGALVLGAALLTALCAQISIPLPGDPVPITGQTFAVLLSAAALGGNRGALSMCLYLALGLVGLPVYSDASSGMHVAWGATGGYLVGFIPAAYVVGRLAEARLDRSPRKALPLFTVGSLIVFAVGVPWLAVAADLSLARAVELGFVPFIAGGIVKAIAAAGLLPAAWQLVGRSTRER